MAHSQVNQRGRMDTADSRKGGVEFHQRHPQAPATVQWVAGVLLPANVTPSNGTWGPRALW